MDFENFLQHHGTAKHHAILFVSKQFEQHEFPAVSLCQFAEKFCHINLSLPQMANAENFYHPDILIVDRKRSQLRLEDVEKIKDFCLYSPQIGTHRLILIEKCERLNLSSANFILKSLEEPQTKVIFLFTSAYKHLLLPTILSRMQTFYVTFPSLPQKQFTLDFDEETLQFVTNTLHAQNTDKVFFGKSLSDRKNFHIKPELLGHLIENCEQLAKKYTAEQLRSLIVYGVSERLKKDGTFVIIARFMMAHIRAWKRAEQLNPSSQFWLLRIFLGQNYIYENYANR